MNKIIFLSFFFIVAHAKDVQITLGTAQLPVELRLLLNEVQRPSKGEIPSVVKTKIDTLKKNSSLFKKSRLFFLTKTEIYKSLIHNKPQREVDLEGLDQKLYNTFNEVPKKKTLTQFGTWIHQSLQSDFKELLNSPLLPTYRLQAKNTGNIQSNLRAIDSKVKILLPWVHFFIHSHQDEFDTFLGLFMLKTLDHLNNYMLLFAEHTKLSPPQNVQYFVEKSMTTNEKIKQRNAKAASLREKMDQLFPDPDPLYVAPKSLPTPVDDWRPENGPSLSQNSKELFPDPDPQYVPPENLPTPTDDW